jgi:membrane protease YdiL (CAAX protease family)
MNGGKVMINDFEQEMEEKELALKEDIKKTGGKCSKILLILAISTYAIAYGTAGIIKIIKVILKSNFNESLVFSKDALGFLAGYLPCIIGDIIAIIIAILITKIKFKQDIFTKSKVSKSFILLGAASCIGIGMISNIIYTIYSTILKLKGITIPQPDFSFPTQRIFLIMFLIYVCLLGPILEEIIFRGFILRSMQKYGNLTAIIVSSVLFSMFHLNLVQFINPVLVGILLAFIAIKSDSIFPSMIAHIFNNTITFMAAAIEMMNIPVLQFLFGGIYFTVGITAFTLFLMKYGKNFVEVIKEDATILKTYEKVRSSFSGAWSIAYIVFYIIFIVGTTVATNIMQILK